MTGDNSIDQATLLNKIQGQIGALAQAIMSMRELPNSVSETNKRLELIEGQLQSFTLTELDDVIANLQYASIKSERAAILGNRWKPSFMLGVLVIVVAAGLAYYIGLKQGVPEKRALISWAEQFKTPNQRQLAEWTLQNEENATIASQQPLRNLKWLSSESAEYAKKFFAKNAYLIAGNCPTKFLSTNEINGRKVCTVWKVER